MDPTHATLIIAGIGLAGLAAILMAGLKAWHGWLELKREQLAPRRAGGEERVDIAELRVRVRNLEEIASCVDP